MNSRFAVAAHILTLLYESDGEPVASDRIAGSVNTNPVVIRRLLSALNRAGLTTGRLGAGGGATLSRPGAAITLLDVHRAVDDGDLFGKHPQGPNPACLVGRHIQATLDAATAAAARALEGELARYTISGIVDDVHRRERRRSRRAASA